MGMHCVGALHSEMLDWLNVGVLQLYDVDVEATADFGRGWSQWGARPTGRPRNGEQRQGRV